MFHVRHSGGSYATTPHPLNSIGVPPTDNSRMVAFLETAWVACTQQKQLYA